MNSSFTDAVGGSRTSEITVCGHLVAINRLEVHDADAALNNLSGGERGVAAARAARPCATLRRHVAESVAAHRGPV